MDYKELYNREKNAIIYGQTVRFRIVKYIVLFIIFGLTYKWRGLNDTLFLLGILFVLGILVHFFFRWKSKGWTQSWWLYKHRQ